MAGAARIAPGRYLAIVTASALPPAFGVVTTVFVVAAAIAGVGFVLSRPWIGCVRESAICQ
jgi:hypothetical protein